MGAGSSLTIEKCLYVFSWIQAYQFEMPPFDLILQPIYFASDITKKGSAEETSTKPTKRVR